MNILTQVKISKLDLDCATFTCVPHGSNLVCSTASTSRILKKCQGSTSIPFTFPFENQALDSISHLHSSLSATSPKVLLAPSLYLAQIRSRHR